MAYMKTLSGFLNRAFRMFAAALIAVPFFAVVPVRAATVTGCASGNLIKGSLPAAYYCGADGKRYVFPNDKAYFTWYPNFAGVQSISDADLANIMIGGNVTYRPGVKMVKIQSDPKVYAVAKGGMLRWVSSESVAVALYGSDWNKEIDDISDAFFVNYTVGTQISSAVDYSPSGEQSASPDINTDKSMIAGGTGPASVTIAASPDSSSLATNSNATVIVSATDPAGVSTIWIFVNGGVVQTCNGNGATSATCTLTLAGSSYANGSSIAVYGQTTNPSNVVTKSATKTISVVAPSSSAATVSLSLSPYSSSLAQGQSTTAMVMASDSAGLSTISVYVNGAPIKTCPIGGPTAGTCSVTLSAADYAGRQSIAVYGQEVNQNGIPETSPTATLPVI